MNRRGILAAIAALFAGSAKGQEADIQGEGQGPVVDWVDETCPVEPEWCDPHKWVPCAWITWDDNDEVPTYYPPAGLIRVEVCSHCGLIRVPPDSLEGVLKGK